MEQFLNDCDDEEEEEEVDDNVDEMYDEEDADFDLNTPHDDLIDSNIAPRYAVSDEIQALQKFRQYLLQLIDRYTLPKNTTIIMDWSNFLPGEEEILESCHKTDEQKRQIYAANLIYSEIRILQFYIWVSERLLQHQLLLLKQQNSDETLPPLFDDSSLTKPMLKLTDDDMQLLNRQVDDLISAYLKLRH